MCGIIGYTGKKQAAEILLRGLGALEYRGYDSAGISVTGEQGIVTVKRPGRVAQLCSEVEARGGVEGCCGIGLTRRSLKILFWFTTELLKIILSCAASLYQQATDLPEIPTPSARYILLICCTAGTAIRLKQ